MKQATQSPAWYFVDEAGDPVFYGAGKKVIVGDEGCSRILCLGYLHTCDPQQVRDRLAEVRIEIAKSNYLKSIPSLQKSLVAFHAKDDCPEVRHLVYEALMKAEFSAQVVVARKREHQFRVEFGESQERYYEKLIQPLFLNRLHLHSPTTIVFSRRGNKTRQHSFREAVELTANRFHRKYGGASTVEIDVQTNQMVQEPALQGADYILWAVQRAYEKNDMRYFEFCRERIELLVDIYDWEKIKLKGIVYYGRKKNPFHISKASPLS
jgi:hypothetical protein